MPSELDIQQIGHPERMVLYKNEQHVSHHRAMPMELRNAQSQDQPKAFHNEEFLQRLSDTSTIR